MMATCEANATSVAVKALPLRMGMRSVSKYSAEIVRNNTG